MKQLTLAAVRFERYAKTTRRAVFLDEMERVVPWPALCALIRRLAPRMDGDRRRLELAYSLLFTLPGSPVIRYGDEFGMGDDLKLPERNCARTPMQWSNEPHGGFTKSDKPHIPVISGGPYGYEHINAAIQRRYPESLLNWTERTIRMRKEVPEVGWGAFTVVP